MKFVIHNLGCKVNAYEAESVADGLEKTGLERTTDEKEADVAVIFTCAVTNTAAQKSRQLIHRMKRGNERIITVVAGCYAQIDPDVLDEAEILVGTRYKNRIPEFVQQYFNDHQKIRTVAEMPEKFSFEEMTLDRFETRTRAYLKIQDGCNQFCSYCVIPYARGRERSMAPDTVLQEAGKLAEKHAEIVLSGIHTGRYGREYGCTLSELMRRMLKELPDYVRLRISSIEMTEVTDDLIALMKEDRRVARHLHIPLQSGCDATLKRMHRPYTTAEYLARVEQIRAELPGVSISTDLIVGFVGETEEEFQETFRFLQTCAFSFLHVFPYSLRSGTAAEKMTGHLDSAIKKERVKKCTQLSGKLYDNYKESRLGKEAEVLIESYENGYSFGHTSEYLPVYIAGEIPQGTYCRCKPQVLKDHDLYVEETI